MKRIVGMRFSDKEAGLLSSVDMRKVHNKPIYWAMFLILLFVSLICLVPVIWVALSGFKSVSELYAVPPTLLPESINLGKIAEVWETVSLFKYFVNSVNLILGCWAFDIIINGLAGYVLSRVKPMGSRVIEVLVFWSMMLPGISMVPLYMTFVDVPLIHVNLVGSYLPIWLMSGASAFNILLFRNFFNSIPMDYIEAAGLDGCSPFGIFIKIILPLSRPIIMVVTIFTVTGTWGNFMWPYLMLGNTNLEPVAVMLYNLSSKSGMTADKYLLLLMMSILPMILVYAVFSKHIMGGIDIGGIKG